MVAPTYFRTLAPNSDNNTIDNITNRVWTNFGSNQAAFPVYIYFVLHAHILFTKLQQILAAQLLYFCALPETSELWRCTTISSIFPSFNHFSCSFFLRLALSSAEPP